MIMLAYGALSLSRAASLHVNYFGAVATWDKLSHLPLDPEFKLPDSLAGNDDPINVCVGKEWHRFPNSFFLPDDRWRLRFLRSEFRGQLPQPYLKVCEIYANLLKSF